MNPGAGRQSKGFGASATPADLTSPFEGRGEVLSRLEIRRAYGLYQPISRSGRSEETVQSRSR
jgi:hypothetical protein